MTYRAAPIGTVNQAQALVESGTIGFVEKAYPPKLVLRATNDLRIGIGNHSAVNIEGVSRKTSALRVLHAPIRSADALRRRAEYGRQSLARQPDPTIGWHLKRWARLDDRGELGEDWRANSQSLGRVSVKGTTHKLIRDRRLKQIVAPHLRTVLRSRNYPTM